MSDNELLLALSDMLDKKLDAKFTPIENRVKRIEIELLENNILPRLNTIETCYTDTYNRYKDGTEQMNAIFDDVTLLKKVVAEHAKKLQMIS